MTTPTTPKERRAQLESKIEAAHDWLEGQTYGGNGTQLSSTDVCQICGLSRHYFSDEQNEIDGHHTYKTPEGDITMSAAAARGCQ